MLFVFLCVISMNLAFVPITNVARSTTRMFKLYAASTELADLQNVLFDEINAALGLKESISNSYAGSTGWSVDAKWYDESKGNKLTGVTKAILSNDQETVFYLNGWMGPSFFVPHMLLEVSKNSDGKYSLNADLIPRGPNAFGTDDTYVQTYYGNEVLSWYENAYGYPNVVPLPPSKSFSSRLLRSPVQVAIGNLDYDSVQAIASKHVSRWLEWIKTAKPAEARQKGALNGRDDKLRQFAFRGTVLEASNRFGPEDGRLVGGYITGPVAEAYVGGGG